MSGVCERRRCREAVARVDGRSCLSAGAPGDRGNDAVVKDRRVTRYGNRMGLINPPEFRNHQGCNEGKVPKTKNIPLDLMNS